MYSIGSISSVIPVGKIGVWILLILMHRQGSGFGCCSVLADCCLSWAAVCWPALSRTAALAAVLGCQFWQNWAAVCCPVLSRTAVFGACSGLPELCWSGCSSGCQNRAVLAELCSLWEHFAARFLMHIRSRLGDVGILCETAFM